MTEPKTPTADHHQKMVDRVAKLLRQAEDAERAGRDAEMVAFQEKAFAIMASYGIDEALARARQDGLDIKVEAKAASVCIHLHGSYQPQQAVILHRVAAAMHCQTLQIGGRGGITMKTYGMPDHLQRLQDMWELLAPQALRGVRNARPDKYWDPSELKVYRRNWLRGFAGEIAARIADAENRAAAAAGALVLYKSDIQRAELAMRAEHPNTRRIVSYARYDRRGYAQGQLAGKTAQLHRSVRSGR